VGLVAAGGNAAVFSYSEGGYYGFHVEPSKITPLKLR
jgi:hypothetical protein